MTETSIRGARLDISRWLAAPLAGRILPVEEERPASAAANHLLVGARHSAPNAALSAPHAPRAPRDQSLKHECERSRRRPGDAKLSVRRDRLVPRTGFRPPLVLHRRDDEVRLEPPDTHAA